MRSGHLLCLYRNTNYDSPKKLTSSARPPTKPRLRIKFVFGVTKDQTPALNSFARGLEALSDHPMLKTRGAEHQALH